MSIDKAIEVLQNYLRGDEPDYDPDLPDSIRLAIEAMRRLKLLRSYEFFRFQDLLPGETRD